MRQIPIKQFLFVCIVLTLACCASHFQWPVVMTIEDARLQAIHDMQSGNPVVIQIGNGTCWEPGVSSSEKLLLSSLKRDKQKCDYLQRDRKVRIAIEMEKFTYAYNKQIVQLMREKEQEK